MISLIARQPVLICSTIPGDIRYSSSGKIYESGQHPKGGHSSIPRVSEHVTRTITTKCGYALSVSLSSLDLLYLDAPRHLSPCLYKKHNQLCRTKGHGFLRINEVYTLNTWSHIVQTTTNHVKKLKTHFLQRNLFQIAKQNFQIIKKVLVVKSAADYTQNTV